MKIALDAYGGDHAPEVNIQGAVDFIKESTAHVVLTGPKEKLLRLIHTHFPSGNSQISIVDAPDIISMEEKASSSLRNRKDSSMYACVDMVKKGEADACLSAGSSASFMALSVLILGRIGSIERPALVTPMPTLKHHPTYGLDMGATVDCKPIHLVHFALMGQAYASVIRGIKNPRIGLISNGEEATKGNELTRRAHEMLKKVRDINYAGYCEGKDIFSGDYDVFVCDGFVGNVILKTAEGLGEALMGLLKEGFSSSIAGKLGYLLARSSMRPLKKKLDYAEYGSAPLLGVGGISLICHGRSNSLAIKNALHNAEKTAKENLVAKLKSALEMISEEFREEDLDIQ